MQIIYLGHSCFKIKGKKSTIVTDPFDNYIGFSMPQTEANIVTISHEHRDHNCLDNIKGDPFIIRAPGEYEVGDVSVFGIPSFHDGVKGKERGKNTIYNIEMEEISLCHLGDLGHKLNDKELEEVNGVDVLFVPVGGIYTLDPKQAVEVVAQIEPKIVVSMHFKTEKINESSFGQLATLKDFLEEIGTPELKPVDKLIINKTSLPEEREVVAMTVR